MEPTFFLQCNILYIDHLAVTTSNVERTLADYLGMPGTRLIRGPALNPLQNVLYAFVQLAEGLVVEILGARDNSPVSRHVSQGGGPYHFCFAVPDIDLSIRAAEEMGAKLITAPVSDAAFDGRKIAFLFHEAHGVVEFVEAYPSAVGSKLQNEALDKPACYQPISDNVLFPQKLCGLLRTIFPNMNHEEVMHATLNETPGWDSLGHIRLMMAVELEFEVNIPPEQIPNLITFTALASYLKSSDQTKL